MKDIHKLLQNNRDWADRIEKEYPEFFHQLAKKQHPDYLWIGCS
ncbi:carbonic anhydrase, partial [Stenotrophomonas sp. MY17]|nr:carbonic anhydrase [Stenotrophomonas sp. MY17]